MNKRDTQRTFKRLRKAYDLADEAYYKTLQALQDFAVESCPFKVGDKFHCDTGMPHQFFSGIISEVAYSFSRRNETGYYIRARRRLVRPTKDGREYGHATEIVKPEFIKVYQPATLTTKPTN